MTHSLIGGGMGAQWRDGGSTEGWGLIKLLLTDIIVHGQVFIFFIAVLYSFCTALDIIGMEW